MNNNCVICSKPLTKGQKSTCSKRCQYISFKGAGNPMFNDRKMGTRCLECNKYFSFYTSVSMGKYCSQTCSNKNMEHRKNIIKANTGRKHSDNTKRKMSEARKGIPKDPIWAKKIGDAQRGKPRYYARGEKSHLWRGGATEKNYNLRQTAKYREWHAAVLKRDNYKCTSCGDTKNIEVDHIIPFASLLHEGIILDNYDGLYNINNGRTLCKDCHSNTDSYFQRLPQQIEGKLILAIESSWDKENNSMTLKEYYISQLEDIISQYSV